MPVLYKCDFSAPSRGVLMTIDLLKLQDKFTYVDINPMAGDNKKPDFLKKNPLHSVPVLEDEDFIICDSHVIMTYIVQKYAPESTLYPKDLNSRSVVDQRMYLESTAMTPKIISSMASLRQGLKEITEEQKAAVLELYSVLDSYLENSDYIAVNHLTLADLSCCSSLGTINIFVPIPDEMKNLKKWYSRLGKEDWFKNVNEKGVKMFIDKLKEMNLM